MRLLDIVDAHLSRTIRIPVHPVQFKIRAIPTPAHPAPIPIQSTQIQIRAIRIPVRLALTPVSPAPAPVHPTQIQIRAIPTPVRPTQNQSRAI